MHSSESAVVHQLNHHEKKKDAIFNREWYTVYCDCTVLYSMCRQVHGNATSTLTLTVVSHSRLLPVLTSSILTYLDCMLAAFPP